VPEPLLGALHNICNELVWTEQLPELAHLIRREDIPRLPHRLPRPLTTEQDEVLQQEFRLRNDLGGNVFLLIRHTGVRIGECADLSFDCLRSTGPNQWATFFRGILTTTPMGSAFLDPFEDMQGACINSAAKRSRMKNQAASGVYSDDYCRICLLRFACRRTDRIN
jgi:hypothetical protein